MLNVYYDKTMRVWCAFLTDAIGQIGDTEYAHERDNAIYMLGLERGLNPQKFVRQTEKT